MYRQSSSRNQRSKGIKIKHVLQSCLLLAVCFWLIYQVKHSRDKAKEFDESDAKGSLQGVSGDKLIKLGRKDIHPWVDGTVSKNERHNEAAEEEDEEANGEEIEENKDGEIDEPEDKKFEGKGDGDDETDEHEQEESDTEVGREDDFTEDEEREDIVKNKIQETEPDNVHSQGEEISTEDADHDANDRSMNEAREEHYRADDASSAVTHDTQMAATENENEHLENVDGNPHNILEDLNKENNSEETNERENKKDLEVEGQELITDDQASNMVTNETAINLLDNSNNGSNPNNTVTEGFSHGIMSNISSNIITENRDLQSQSLVKSEPMLDQTPDLTQGLSANQSNSSTLTMVDISNFGFNSTGSTEAIVKEFHYEELSNLPNNTDASTSQNITKSDGSVEAGNNDGSSSENNGEFKVEESNANNSTNEYLEATTTENPVHVESDTTDTLNITNSLEDKHSLVDLDTLPEMQTEGTYSKDVAAE